MKFRDLIKKFQLIVGIVLGIILSLIEITSGFQSFK